MIGKDIYNAVQSFRLAILEAKYNGAFGYKNRLCKFPAGCCDDACDLLAYYLKETFGISTQQGNGVYRDNNPYNTTNHAWLIIGKDVIVDITIEQFARFSGITEDIYIGKPNNFYMNLENKKIYSNCDIRKDNRLWDSYEKIMQNMSEVVD